jgi:RNA polymerase sigma-70 factor (ECF subfamily)
LKEELIKPAQGSDIALVRRAQAGDGDAFTELFQQLHTPVLNYVYRTMGDRHAAEDITQDAFIRAHQRIGQLGPPYDFKSWVFRIASNLAIDSLRQSKRFVDLEEPMEPLGPMTTKRPAERKVQQAQAQKSVQDTLALMPTAYRQAIILRELNGLGYQEVANALECSYDNARQLVHRARLNFRELHGLRLLATSGAVQCREIGDLLSALHDGELSPENRRAVRKHIKSCEHCQETEKDMRKVAGIVAGLTPILPSPGWIQQVMERLQSQGLQPVPAQAAQAPGPASAGAVSPGTAVSGSGWALKLVAGLVVGMIAAGALFAAGVWAFRQLVSNPPNADPQVVEATLQAILALTPAATEASGPENLAPVAAPVASATPTATQMADEVALIEPGPPIAIALANSNCRFGPGSIYDIIDYLLQDQETPILGRDAQWFWWKVERIDHPGACWVANNLVDERGDTSQVPIVPAPPTPTPVDNKAPTLMLSHSPTNPLSNDPVTFDVSASDPGGVAWIEIWVRPPGQSVASLLGTCQNSSTCRLQGGPYTAGQGQYFARAADHAGNQAESNTLSFDVDWYIG